jgi:putative spermidine/putrescine transport system ATP-binding protein
MAQLAAGSSASPYLECEGMETRAAVIAPRRRAGSTLAIANISKRYGAENPAVDNVSLEITTGEFVTLLGASGSGKTTTLMVVAGFTAPDHGDVVLDGRSVVHLPPEKRGIGVVFQNYALFPHMTALRNVAFPLRMRGVPQPEAKRRAETALERVGLVGFGARLPSQLSGGQQQRVALARALVFEPGLLLMDEPLGALDRALREQLKGEIRRLHQDLGITILYVTHDQEEALTLSDRIALMSRGRIVQVGTPADLYERPRSRFAAGFIGEGSLIEGTVVSEGGGLLALAPKGGAPLLRGVSQNVAEGSRGVILLRPEKLRIRSPDQDGLPAEVAETVYVGDVTRVTLRMASRATIVAKQTNRAGDARLRTGDAVRIDWAREDAVILAADDDAAFQPDLTGRVDNDSNT